MTTVVDKPLTFTLTPQSDGVRSTPLRVHDHIPSISGYVDYDEYGECCDDHY